MCKKEKKERVNSEHVKHGQEHATGEGLSEKIKLMLGN
jgi:hypothetical protein